MIHKQKLISVSLAALLFVFSLTHMLYAAEEGKLSADSIQYNTNTKKVKAAGNVVINRGGVTLFGNTADGDINTSEFQLKGEVRGIFTKEKAELTAETLKWASGNNKKDNGKVEAFGNVHITRNKADKLDAEYVLWELNTENFTARGRVDAVVQDRLINAGEAGRSGEKFWGRDVTRYEDRKQKIGIAAKLIDGVIRDGVVQEIVATEDVKMDYIDKEGFKTVITGAKAIYSKDRGTVVVSGNAKAVRGDGKTVTADNIVLYEDTKNIEASGHAKVSFVLPEKDKKK